MTFALLKFMNSRARRFVSWIIMSLLVAVSASAATPATPIFRTIDGELEDLQLRVDLIHRAKREVSMLYFSFMNDEVSLDMIALLRDAASRGVKVRVLVDQLNDGIPGEMML